MNDMPAPPAGFDPEGPTFQIVGELPVFEMPRSWADPRLSLAAIGLLARVQAGPRGPFELHDFTGGDRESAAAIAGELAALGILRGNELVDPARPARPAPPVNVKPYAPDPGTVYYLLRQDGAVKIGHTGGRLSSRVRSLVRAWGPLELLATERGSVVDEDARHQQFRALRMPDQGPNGGTEFFHTGPALVRHIEALRATGLDGKAAA